MKIQLQLAQKYASNVKAILAKNASIFPQHKEWLQISTQVGTILNQGTFNEEALIAGKKEILNFIGKNDTSKESDVNDQVDVLKDNYTQMMSVLGINDPAVSLT